MKPATKSKTPPAAWDVEYQDAAEGKYYRANAKALTIRDSHGIDGYGLVLLEREKTGEKIPDAVYLSLQNYPIIRYGFRALETSKDGAHWQDISGDNFTEDHLFDMPEALVMELLNAFFARNPHRDTSMEALKKSLDLTPPSEAPLPHTQNGNSTPISA